MPGFAAPLVAEGNNVEPAVSALFRGLPSPIAAQSDNSGRCLSRVALELRNTPDISRRRAARGSPSRARRVLACGALLAATLGHGYETDPYAKRHLDIADSLEVLDAKVNVALDEIAGRWQGGRNEWAFVMAVYWKVGGAHYVDKLERWAMRSPEVEKITVARSESVVADFPIWASRVAGLFGVSPTIKVAGVFFGTDKIGHFFSQGRKFYGRYRRLRDESKAARQAIFTENWLFGRLTTGIYSNADLVANYEGYRFYRSLFHDDAVTGRRALFRWEGATPVRQRAYTWADHVNPFWDEALNPNLYGPGLLPTVEHHLLRLCDDFKQRPERYRVPNADALFEHYRRVGVVDTSALRPETFLAANCAGGAGRLASQ